MPIHVPGATYRLQLSRAFRFEDARAVVAYLERLGITDLYASPVFQARAGSAHGYDVTDPTRLNPELGSGADFVRLVRRLRREGLGLVLDIVPNHMALAPENRWWMDVLEYGRSSPHADWFGIRWGQYEGRRHRIALPVLGAPYGEVLERGELRVALEESGFVLRYHEHRFPIHLGTALPLLRHRLPELERAARPGGAARFYRALVRDIERRFPRSSAEGPRPERRAIEELKRRLGRLAARHESIRAFLEENLREWNGAPGDAASFDRLDALLRAQAYELGFWRTTARRMNYRRFFTIQDLVGVRVERPEVFDATHALILRLAREGKARGLRIDHVDGLADPEGYLRRLDRELARSGVSPRPWRVVEKILGGDETLPAAWPVHGTTGYDFLRSSGGVLVDPRGLEELRRVYREFTGVGERFADLAYTWKRRVIVDLFPSELQQLEERLAAIARGDRHARDLDREVLREAIVEASACLSVYRTYVRGTEVGEADRARIVEAIAEGRRRSAGDVDRALDFLGRVLLEPAPSGGGEAEREARVAFTVRWQQFTGPAMAKGVEDTVFYQYNALLSLNEVGSEPEVPVDPVAALHRHGLHAAARWPHALNTTSTHDTKRGEDARARLHALSDVAPEWARRLARWSRWNERARGRVDGEPVPDRNEEAGIYQSLLGAWPADGSPDRGFRERFRAFVVKAAREAKVRTSWSFPDEARERALVAFVDSILGESRAERFSKDFRAFLERLAWLGALNSLSQVVLKSAFPGVPDFYQGAELWDLSLVDPDNRRPVDFEARASMLAPLERLAAAPTAEACGELLKAWRDGRVKLYVTHAALALRRRMRPVFDEGAYVPLAASGPRASHVCAFARRREDAWAVAAVPRLVARLFPRDGAPAGPRAWQGTLVPLPRDAPREWTNVLTGERVCSRVRGRHAGLAAADLFASFPVALLR